MMRFFISNTLAQLISYSQQNQTIHLIHNNNQNNTVNKM